jgi:putative FmdB family regulatory protein
VRRTRPPECGAAVIGFAVHVAKRGAAVPLYEYECPKCRKRFEKIEKVTARSRQKCPKCGAMAERLQARPAIHFKGSGWYVTDYARKGASGAEGKEAKEGKVVKDTKEAKDSKETKETKEAPKEKKAAKDK